MTGLIPTLILFAFVGWILAALMVGLWWGEKGRRAAVERMVVYGTPDLGPAKPVSRAPAKEAEDRLADAPFEFSEETVTRLMDDLKLAADAQGISVTEEQLRAEALQLLAGNSVDN